MSYQQRQLEVEFTLGEGDFDGSGGNTITLKNMKCEISIAVNGGREGTTASISVYGLSRDYMAKLTSKTQKILAQKQHSIRIRSQCEFIFSGTIVSSRINLNQLPDAPIEITANAVDRERYIACEPTTMQGDVSVEELIKSIATRVGLKFINVDVNLRETNPHYTGNAIEQINKIATNHDISADIDMGTVSIYTGANPVDGVALIISKDNGLIGYPIFYDIGVNFRCMYSSAMRLGRKITLKTGLPFGDGEYLIQPGTTHYLSSNSEGGMWETFVVAMPANWEM